MSWIIVPFSRPGRLDNVIANFERQLCDDKKLCVVENGDAVGRCKEIGFAPNLLLTSDAHPSLARNVGMEAVREMDGHFCCMDDDDFYGQYYQQEHLNYAARGRITGKGTHWVRFDAVGRLWLFNRKKAGKQVAWVQACTVGGFARDVPNFPVVDLGEEIDLCRNHRRAGGEVLNTSVGNFLYVRSHDESAHLYKITPRGFADAHGPWFEEHPDDFRLLEETEPPLGVKKAYNQV